MRPRLLDLFCGAGGAAMGYHRAGFDVVGVDIKPQPHYPFEFHQADALDWLTLLPAAAEPFDVVHASPPCQRFSSATPTAARGGHPDLIGELRDRLTAWGGLWVMENVPQAPLYQDVLLCGSMFGLRVVRHRVFECWILDEQPDHPAHGDYITVTGGGPCNNPSRPGVGGPRRKGTADEARAAMGIDWMTKTELNEAIPPAYTECIGQQLIRQLERVP